MKTIVVTFPNELIDFSDTMPFLYPVLQDTTIHLEDPKQFDHQNDYEALARRIEIEVKRTTSRSWQIIFILPISKTIKNYLRDTTASHLEELKDHFLPLLKKFQIKEPDHLFVILLDSLERDPYLGDPINTNQKLLWEIDTLGYIKSNDKENEIEINNRIKSIEKKLNDAKSTLKYLTKELIQIIEKLKGEKINNEANVIRKKESELKSSIKSQKELIKAMSESLEKEKKNQSEIKQKVPIQQDKDSKGKDFKNFFQQACFTQSDINTVAAPWDQLKYDIQIGLQKVNTDAGIIDVKNDDNSGADVAEKIENCCEEVQEELINIIESKKKFCKEYKDKTKNDKQNDEIKRFPSNFQHYYNKLKEDFENDLKQIQKIQIIKFLGKDPIRNLLQKHVRENFSVVSEKFEQFTCIRYDMTLKQRGKYRNKMLQLTYLILFLIDNGRLVYQNPKSLIPGYQFGASNFLHVKKISINIEQFNITLMNYRHHLSIAKQKLLNFLHSDLNSEVFLIENPCECPAHDDLSYQREQSTNKKYKDYLPKRLEYIESTIAKKVDELLDECAIEMNQWIAINKYQGNLSKKQLELKGIEKSSQENLIKSSLVNINKKCAKEINDLKALNQDILNLESICSSAWLIILCVCISILSYLLPAGAEKLLSDSMETAWTNTPVIAITLLFIVTIVLIKIYEIRELKYYKEKALLKADQVEKFIQKTFRNNIDYIKRVCSFNAANRNIQRVRDALEDAKRNYQQMQYHEKEINMHIEFVDHFLENNVSTMQENKIPRDMSEVIYSKPTDKNPVYSPASINREALAYRLRMGTARKSEVSIKTRLMPALDEITITYDLLYLERQ